jgi:hypothetical protein
MKMSRNEKAGILIDSALGQCNDRERKTVDDLLAGDFEAQHISDDIKNALSALAALPSHEPFDDLVPQTIQRIEQYRTTQNLIAHESRRPMYSPTFSLREVLTVAAVLVVMVLLFVPSIKQAKHVAMVNVCASNMGRIGTGLTQYANMNGDYLPAPETTDMQWLPLPDKPVSTTNGLFKLVRRDYTDPTLFQCPAVECCTFVMRDQMSDFPAAKYVSYSYQHDLGVHKLRLKNSPLDLVASKMAIMGDSNPIFVDGKFHPELLQAKASPNHNGQGQNVLYLDMHVNWSSDANAGIDGDNIYTIQGVTQYRGDEAPARPTDSFLLPVVNSQN